MHDTTHNDLPGRQGPHPAVAALTLALLAAAQTGLEVVTRGSPPWGTLLVGRALPALLWVGATPVIMRLGRRWPVRERVAADLAAHAVTFALWFAGTNLLIRLPRMEGGGWAGVVADTWEGMVAFAPTTLLLWCALAWLGRGPALHAGTEPATASTGPTPPAAPTTPAAPDVVPITGANRIHLVAPCRIRHLDADGDHVRVFTVEGTHRVRGTLTDFERTLAATGAFVRIHRSHLVNVEHVREVQPFQHGDWVAVMTDGAELRIPRTRRRALERLLGRAPER